MLLCIAIVAILAIFLLFRNWFYEKKAVKIAQNITLSQNIADSLFRKYSIKETNQKDFTWQFERVLGKAAHIEQRDPVLFWRDSAFETNFQNDHTEAKPVVRILNVTGNRGNDETLRNRFELTDEELGIGPKSPGYLDQLVFRDNTRLWRQFSQIALADSVGYKWRNVWSRNLLTFLVDRNFRTANEFTRFITANLRNYGDTLIWNEYISHAEDVKRLQSASITAKAGMIDSLSMQVDVIQFSSLIFIFFFGLRYISTGLNGVDEY